MSEPYIRQQDRAQGYTYTEDNNGSVSKLKFGPYAYLDELVGVTNPSWRHQIRDHQQAGTPLSANTHNVFIKEGFMELITQDRSASSGALIPGTRKTFSLVGSPIVKALPLALSSADVSIADAKASGSFYASARKLTSPNNIAEGLGEYRESVKLLRNRGTQLFRTFPKYVDRLVKTCRGLSSPKFRKLPRSIRKTSILKMASDSYLEYNFGVRPLIKDIASAVSELQRTPNVLDYSVTSGNGETFANASVIDRSNLIGNLLVCWSEYGIEKAQVRYKGAVVLEKADTSSLKLNDIGVSMDNFVPTLYQLIPLSFVLDYFSNLGSIVNAACYGTSRLAWCIRTERRVTQFLGVTTAARKNSIGNASTFIETISQTHSPSSLLVDRKRIIRSVISNPPVPSLVLSIPNDPTTWTNLGALVASRMSTWRKLLTLLLR